MRSKADEVVYMLEDEREAIAALCERHAVARMFGSALRDACCPGKSDIDLLVEFVSMDPYEKAKACFGLLAGLGARTWTWSRRVRSGTAPSSARSIERGRCRMRRSPRAALADVIEAGATFASAPHAASGAEHAAA